MINDYILKSIIYGGIDGIVTMFNIVAGITGAKLHSKYIFILGFAVLISDGLSMGVGDYLSLKADIKTKENNEDKDLVKDIYPVKNGIITFSSFVIFGFIPICIYYFINGTQNNKFIKIFISIIISLFILGIIQSKYTHEKWYYSGTKLSIFGGTTSILAYNISRLIMKNIQ
jgi:VIT1/CCC1 family predicted Fe2+/Mn2+ transporter